METNFQHCAALVREAERDRYLATLFAPAEHRDALFALYAFNVEIGHVRDLARQPMPGEIRLQWWREALTGERGGEASAHPVAAALRDTLSRYAIAPAPLLALIDAHTFDLYDEPMASFGDFAEYADKTDAALFTVAGNILGARGAAAETITHRAGIAHTVTGLLSRFGLHASRRQLFLPLDLLGRHGAEREDIFAGRATPELRATLAELRIFARRHLAAAEEELQAVPPALWPALLPAALIQQTLAGMELAGYEPFQPQLIAPWRRQWLLWRAARDPSRIFRA
jgi:15-cis-phytoene synthase